MLTNSTSSSSLNDKGSKVNEIKLSRPEEVRIDERNGPIIEENGIWPTKEQKKKVNHQSDRKQKWTNVQAALKSKGHRGSAKRFWQEAGNAGTHKRCCNAHCNTAFLVSTVLFNLRKRNTRNTHTVTECRAENTSCRVGSIMAMMGMEVRSA